jgi:gliding motility-associated-like protein
LSSDKICNLLLVIDEKKNCACQNIFIPIEKIKWKKTDIQVCSGEKTSLGVAPQNHFYQWNPPTNLSCANCANPIFTYNNDSDKNVIVNYQFLDTIPKCYVDYNINVVVASKLKISASKTGICKGESVVLKASDGTAYNWSGNGILNATTQSQTLSPPQTSAYKVTITTGKCTGIDSFLVKVGGGNGSKKDTICEGEKIIIENTTFTESGNYGIKYKIGANCDSTFTLQLTVLPKPIVTIPTLITVKEGESQTIDIDGKNYTFSWTPSLYLSCNNCPNPIVKPEKDTLYTIQFTDKNGCADTRSLQVKIAPNCAAGSIVPVSVFMPDGDVEANRKFRFYGLEGKTTVTASVKIFNRWGEKVFEILDQPDPQWDGFFKKEAAPTDIYIVLYKINCGESGEWKKIDVSLLR